MTRSSLGSKEILNSKRISVLSVSLVVALGSGTNYVYSGKNSMAHLDLCGCLNCKRLAYGPQLARRLNLTYTQSSIIGIAGNIGVFSSAPIGGKVADSLGSQPLLAAAFILLLGGYSGIRYFYDSAVPLPSSDAPKVSYALLILFNFMTGVGGTSGMMSGMNATAKSFPDSARATTTGLVLSGFGLSAFLFSTVSALLFPGDTSSLLLLLTLGTALPMLLGFFFLKPVASVTSPSRVDAALVDTETGTQGPLNVVFHHCNNSHESDRLLGPDEMAEACRYEGTSTTQFSQYPTPTPDSSRAMDYFSDSSMDAQQLLRERQTSSHWTSGEPNVYGRELFKSLDFWLVATVFGLLAGTGLMYINNVGSIAHALADADGAPYDEKIIPQIQAKQVTAISVMNCLGRIAMGLTSDYAKNSFGAPRSYCLVLASLLFLCSQVAIISINDLDKLWIGSIMLGFSYGSAFALVPTLCIYYFGMSHFSENFGFTTLSPMVSGYVFSVIFGKTLDEHEGPTSPSRTAAHQCTEGRGCYANALHFTIGACLLALGLSLFMSFRDRRAIVRAYEDRLSSREVESG
ncbi:hypothetical protein HGRIS_014115 [Hohenbuehelia grisea]|uniref:MFS general substrate transporter n=1 Tax=Hohenbuehelia grisea TaxID=104357 RepID=A0ABR3JUD3_9AGAR